MVERGVRSKPPGYGPAIYIYLSTQVFIFDDIYFDHYQSCQWHLPTTCMDAILTFARAK